MFNSALIKNALKRTIVIIISIILLMLVFVFADTGEKRVLILNSYNKGLLWTDQQTEAIVDAIDRAPMNIAYNIEYLDWKQYPEQQSLDLQKALYKYKYLKSTPDLIMTTDDAALEFAVRNKEELFPGIPVVFSGVSRSNAEKFINGRKDIVGVYETIDAQETLKIALKLNNHINKLYILHDNSEGGMDTADSIRNAVDKIKPSLEINYLNNLSIEDICKKVSQLDKDSIIIVGSYSKDLNGFQLSPEKLVNIISHFSKVPIYDLYDFRLGSGSVGGSLLSGELQGKDAAKLALQVLAGKPVDRLKNIDEKTIVNAFDYKQLKKYHLPMGHLPKDSIIINNPYNTLKAYRIIIIAVGGFVIFCTTYIILLTINVRRRKKVEEELKATNREITEVYEELAASEEELYKQLEEIMESQEQLTLSEQRYKLAVESSNDSIWDWDLVSGKRTFTSMWYSKLGYTSEDIDDFDHWFQLVHPDDKQAANSKLELHLEGKTNYYSSEYRVKCANGEYKWIQAKGKALVDKSGKPYRMIGAYTDITQLKSDELKIKQMAYYDSLTGLPNRAYLIEYVSNELSNCKENKSPLDLIYIDMDNFKMINDTYGHSHGDKLLCEIGSRINSFSQYDSMVFRIGGDEFVIILKQIKNKGQIEAFAQELIDKLKEPIIISDNTIYASVSVGIVTYPEDGQTFEELLKNADAAMYDVKEKGKRGYGFFNKKINEALIEKMNLERSLRKALERNEFKLHYQPQISTATGEIIGFEALLRWFSPELGNVPPYKFIKTAEDTGLIIPIGEWVIKTACNFAVDLQKRTNSKRFISINLSTLQLRQDNFVSRALEIIKESKVDPTCIEMEITETILIDSFENNIEKLNQLRQYGIHISLDDFGTGYSSLTYLRRLPINTLKIDKSFVDDILVDEGNKRIINSMIQLAHSLGLIVVAEGVEQQAQYEYLSDSCCDLIQGYYISKPVSEEDIIKMVSK